MNSDLNNAVKSLAEIGIHIPDAITSQSGQTLERLLKDNLLLSNRAGTTLREQRMSAGTNRALAARARRCRVLSVAFLYLSSAAPSLE